MFLNFKPRSILLCPGPVIISKRVAKAVAKSNIGHREAEFSQLLAEMIAMVKPVVGLEATDKSYEVAFITGSGTAANETILSSLSSLGRTLVISNGEFGERLYDVTRLHTSKVDHLSFGWQQPINLDLVDDALSRHDYSLVAMVHHETSTGMLNPVAEVAALAHKYGALISVDAVSSIGAEAIEVKSWGVDALSGASGKALSAMPGVGILVLSKEVLARLDASTRSVHYLDLHKHFHYMRELAQTPNTPAVHVFVSLHAALTEIHRIGLTRFRERIAARAAYVRRVLPQLGLHHAVYGPQTSRVITCVSLPPYMTFDRLTAHLKRRGIVIYNGKGPLKDKIFQIGHIGALKRRDTRLAIKLIKRLIDDIHEHELAHIPEPAADDQRQVTVRR
ncbi:MAG: hypothetical protein K0S68_152 [Candidatus Saccharibacteria bacterium]|nr:hypothetical protein [Candidatus Saccharibacteria bacterium]